MLICEIISLCLIVVLCIICTKSDLKKGIIYNKVLGVFLFLAAVNDVIYYGIFVQDLFVDFLVNAVIISVTSLVLFYTHSFAGGDCKMIIIIALLYPGRFYWTIGNSNATLVLVVPFAILAGYCYLFCNSIYAIVGKKVVVSFEYIKDYMLSFLKSYTTAMVYISLFNQLIMLLYKFEFNVNIWMIRILSLIIAWCVGRYSLLKKWFTFVPVVGCVIFISLLTRTWPFSIRIENYILVLILLVCQMTIKTTLYESIAIEQLRKGMILSAFSSALMQTSVTKGLPSISSEDLRSRLTSEEIESIKLWAKATRTESIIIVKKIPFAIFITIGMLTYCAMGGVLLWL